MKEAGISWGRRYRLIVPAGTLFLILILSVFIQSCSSDDPTGVEPPPPEYALVTSKTIGAGGDSLIVADFRLIVPPGAFAGDALLELYASSTVRPYGDDMATRTFRLQGLPADFGLPLPISLKPTRSLTNESHLLTTAEYYAPEVADTVSVYVFLTTADSVGHLHGEIAPPDAAHSSLGSRSGPPYPSAKNGRDDPLFFGITDWITYEQQSPFAYSIRYPAAMVYALDEVTSFFVAAHSTLSDLGLGYVFDDPEIGTLQAHFQPSAEFILPGYACYGLYRKMSSSTVNLLYLDAGLLVGQDHLASVERQIRREIHRWLQATLELGDATQNMWLHEAFSCWSETMLPEEQLLQPTGFAGNEMAPFLGAQAGSRAIGNPVRHGRGMSAVMKHLIDDYNENLVLQCYEDIVNGQPEYQWNTVISRIGPPTTNWWPAFFRKYVAGNIYGVAADVFLNNALDELDATSNGVTTFTASYTDLSAKSYLVNLHESAVDSNTYVRFQIDSPDIPLDYLTVLVFGSKPGRLDYLSEGEFVTFVDVEDLLDQGYTGLFAVVVNSGYEAPEFSGSGDVNMNFTMDSPEINLPQLTNLVLSIENIQRFFTFTHDSCGVSGGFMAGTFNYSQSSGSFSDATYSTSWDYTWFDVRMVGNLAVTLDPTYSYVTEFTIHEVETDLNSGNVNVRDFAGADIPETSLLGYPLEYMVAGANTCDYFEMELQGTNPVNDCVKVIDWIQCTDTSGIYIGFFP
jgi:hypothetical protein